MEKTFLKQSQGLIPVKNACLITKSLVAPWARRRSQTKVARISLMFGVPPITHSCCQAFHVCSDNGARYVALRIKCSPFGQHNARLRLHEENAGINTRFFVVLHGQFIN
jgi:hypothetical protein